MQKHVLSLGILALLLVLPFALPVAAQDAAELAKQSEEKAASTAGDPPTPKQIIDKVKAGCELLKGEGLAGLAKFQGSDSDFIFNGTYIWIHDMDGNMVMHPIKYKMNGKPLIGLKDARGKLFFSEMNQVVKANDDGWVDYMWPKPGEKKPSKKVSYVLLCPVEGKELVLGCGVYGLSEDDIKKAMQ